MNPEFRTEQTHLPVGIGSAEYMTTSNRHSSESKMNHKIIACLIVASALHLPSSTLAQDAKPSFESLFNGTDLTGWKHSGNWKVQDGIITREGRGGSLVYSVKPIPDNFELRFDWKVAKGSNSGVYYRPGQYEYQILDNNVHADGKNPRTSAASLYFCMQPSEDATKPVGEWNSGRIVCKGSVIQHWLNGKKIIDFDYTDPRWSFNVNMLKLRGANLANRKAKLSLQDHGDPVWYRNIKLRSIPDSEDIAHTDVKPAVISEEILKKEKAKLDGIVARRNASKQKKK